MKINYFASMWGNELTMPDAIQHASKAGFDGVEGPALEEANLRSEMKAKMQDEGLHYITEITTGGSYVPDPKLGIDAHLDDLKRKVEASLEMEPIKVNIMFGLDAWPLHMQVEAFGKALQFAKSYSQPTVFELHRSRSMYNPWVTRDLMLALPDLQLNCDFSHWCAVAERLVLDDDESLLQLCAERCGHIHARVGYEQGPQVADPRAPEYEYAVDAHIRWWQHIVTTQNSAGRELLTITPEFGPDGYLQHTPYTKIPAADLKEINAWMMGRLRDVIKIPEE